MRPTKPPVQPAVDEQSVSEPTGLLPRLLSHAAFLPMLLEVRTKTPSARSN